MVGELFDKMLMRFQKISQSINNRYNFHYQKINFVLIAVVFLSLTIWSWRKWPDLLVDFGQQLYIPWRLANGEHLYTDLAFFHGPLSQYFNALWFYIFGPSLTILIYVNLIILACTTLIIYKNILFFSDRLTATSCAIFFLTVFGFAQYAGIGNYNWITPYTHEATHGAALISASLFFWSRLLIIKYNRLTLIACALCLGLALLTKVDIALAAVAVAQTAFFTLWLLRDKSGKFSNIDALVFGFFFIAPTVFFLLYFLTCMPLEEALAAVGSGLPLILSSDVTNNIFYMRVIGFDNLGYNIALMVQMGLLLSGFIFAAIVVDYFSHRFLKYPLLFGMPLACAVFVFLFHYAAFIPWDDLPRALSLFVLLALFFFIVSFFKNKNYEYRLKLIPLILWIVFALTLLIKIIFNVRFANYGFYLAMPAAIVFISCLLYWIPQFLKSKFKSGLVFKCLIIAFLAAGMINYLKISNHYYTLKNFPIGKGNDMFLTYSPKRVYPIAVMDSALKWIENEMPPEATFAALPEGVMLNYLTRRSTTLPSTNFMMTELIIFGEDNILADLKAYPPDYILLVHKDSFEFGVGYFGRDHRNAYKIMQFINKNYREFALIGNEPFQNFMFGIKIMKLNPKSQNN
jgi:hypothetical protein